MPSGSVCYSLEGGLLGSASHSAQPAGQQGNMLGNQDRQHSSNAASITEWKDLIWLNKSKVDLLAFLWAFSTLTWDWTHRSGCPTGCLVGHKRTLKLRQPSGGSDFPSETMLNKQKQEDLLSDAVTWCSLFYCWLSELWRLRPHVPPPSSSLDFNGNNTWRSHPGDGLQKRCGWTSDWTKKLHDKEPRPTAATRWVMWPELTCCRGNTLKLDFKGETQRSCSSICWDFLIHLTLEKLWFRQRKI